MDELRDKIFDLREALKKTKIMNEDRKKKLLWLTDLMLDVILEEDITQHFFKDIRGGRAT